MSGARPEWGAAQRIVVKIGSALLVHAVSGALKSAWLETLVADIAELRAAGREVVLVSSGAIALGRSALRVNGAGADTRALRLEENQAAAAIGQIALARAYAEHFGVHQLTAAQILLTLGDTEERRRYLNARTTIATLLRMGAVPVVNENDTVATSEIRYGDNDRLAARVASMISADLLVLLSDVDGLYSAPPCDDASARRLDVVERITPEIDAMAGDAGTALSRGGMITKIAAARIATQAGAHMIIASGKVDHPLRRLADGEACTWFLADADPVAARKRWIGGALKAEGRIVIDAGAVAALRAGKSLLPAGVSRVEGAFSRGDLVIVGDAAGQEIARGLTAYDAADVEAIRGRKSGEIEALLGYAGRAALIHRDDLMMKDR